MPKSTCSFDVCEHQPSGNGLCWSHRRQLKETGKLRPLRRKVAPGATVAERINGAYKANPATGCWEWQMATSDGYAKLRINGAYVRVHRASWELVNGPIPEGMFLDHVCGVRRCVNPGHLRVVSNKQNMENIINLDARNSSGYRGVSYDKSREKWTAYVCHNGRFYYLGRHDSTEDAHAAAVAKRIELFTHNDRDRV